MKSIQLQLLLNSTIPQLLSAARLCPPCRVTQTASLDAQKAFVYESLIVVFMFG